ncbi:hypothetical protein C8R45DRAFT_780164, partial [Mycena sanguinolenta]
MWYNDGSVIPQSENTQFRVLILSQHSSFFRDLERLPQPPHQPTVNGCHIVDLPDSVADVEYLTTALYDPSVRRAPANSKCSHFLVQTALPLAVVGALIRLGRKYDF